VFHSLYAKASATIHIILSLPCGEQNGDTIGGGGDESDEALA